MKIKINYEDIKKFEKQVINKKNELNKFLNDLTLKSAMTFFREIVNNTPIVTGVLRNGWYLSEEGVISVGNEYSIDIINNVEYATYVNYGHRLKNGEWLEGQHFIEKAEILTKHVIEENIREEIKKYFKEER